MHFSAQRPHIQNTGVFLRALAEILEQMHERKKPHGSMYHIPVADWLGSDNTFDAERFVKTAGEEASPECDPLALDVRCFAKLAIELIAGHSAEHNATFQAGPYLGGEWPEAFLRLLESLNSTGAETAVITMSDLSRALHQPVSVPEQPVHPPRKTFSIPEPVTSTFGNTAPSHRPAMAQPSIRIALRNATVGKAYNYEPGKIAAAIASQLGHNPEQAYISHIQLPDDCGLTFDKATGSLTGTPTRTFDQEFSLDYVPNRSANSIRGKVTLLINPDPATLWKDLPPAAHAPYQKPILDHCEEQHGPFRVVAASRRGRSHANKGDFRDDDYALGYAPRTGWLVIAVADGAGSAIYSRRGSQIASNSARDRLIAVLNSSQHNQADALFQQHQDWQHPEVRRALRQTLYEAALLAHHKLRDEVKAPCESISPAPVLRNYDTTLILLVIKRVGEGSLAATFAIGDGGAGILPRPSEGIPLTQPDSGEHAGQTLFLTFESTVANTEENLEGRFHMVQTTEFAGALAMSDGITDPKFPSDEAFADPAQWAALWAELQEPLSSSSALLDWMNFFSPGNHDDRTLVAVLSGQATFPATP